MATLKNALKERTTKFVIKPYGYTLHVVVSNDVVGSYKKREKLLGYHEFLNPYAFVWSKTGCNELYAFLPDACGLGATAHEMFHVVTFVLGAVGIELSDSSDEVWAYHIEELVQVVSEFIHKKTPTSTGNMLDFVLNK